jgi:hypothetical protein
LRGGYLVNRLQAKNLLKPVYTNLLEPSSIAIDEIKPDEFRIQIKGIYNKQEIQRSIKKFGLSIFEDSERIYVVVFKKQQDNTYIDLQGAFNELSKLKNASFNDFMDAMFCSSDNHCYAAYKLLFPNDIDLSLKQMYEKVQNFFFEQPV